MYGFTVKNIHSKTDKFVRTRFKSNCLLMCYKRLLTVNNSDLQLEMLVSFKW